MTKLSAFLFACSMSLALTVSAKAQDQLSESVFRDYEHMRSVADEGMMNRNIVNLMRAFGASDEMTDQELYDLEQRVRSLFPRALEHVDVLKSVKLGPDWTQELYAYYGGSKYIYAMVLFHTRETDLIALNFKFNTDALSLLKDF